MTSSDIRARFLVFFEKRGHAILPSASLVPKNDPSVLFNTAGMQPLVPYLLGEAHPAGTRLASAQKCVRTGDIDDIGDNRHLTFFEMLGNWSLGDYFKEDAIKWSYEFLTSKEEGLGLDPARLYVTVFEGDNNAPRDLEAVEIWKQYIPEHRIYFLPAKNNWWSPGDNGPCGPDTEMFYDIAGTLGDMSHEEFVAADDKGDVVEIWNDVFMQYLAKDGKVVGQLSQKNVDTGSGLERIAMIVQGKSNVFENDMFAPIMETIKAIAGEKYKEDSARIIADHIRTSAMMIADGVLPSNKDQGYILRRLIRRATMRAQEMGFFDKKDTLNKNEIFLDVLNVIFDTYKDTAHFTAPTEPVSAPEVQVIMQIAQEVGKFKKTLEAGLKEFEKGIDAFTLATTYGFPIELTLELAKEKEWEVDVAAFNERMMAHQAASRAGAEQKFKGGLSGATEMTTKLHTAHHLLLAALQTLISPDIHQKGSNITDERLRIDFNLDRKLTEEEKHDIEAWVNDIIANDYSVVRREMPKADAESIGAEMEFGTTYPDIVSVYSIEDKNGNAVSKEFCGGPHVEHTGALGTFRILKEEASSAGIRRIKATLS
ncbi:MAG TPA: alanine--tRNA ligase [Candidatus Paceibacterota bacterium]